MVSNAKNDSYTVVSKQSEYTTTDLLGERQTRQVRHELECIGVRWSKQLDTMTRAWLRQVGLDLLLDYAIPATAAAPAPSVRYLAAIMRRCLASGYRSAADAWQRDEDDRRAYLAARQPKARPVAAQMYHQRDYSGQEEVNDLIDWLREDAACQG